MNMITNYIIFLFLFLIFYVVGGSVSAKTIRVKNIRISDLDPDHLVFDVYLYNDSTEFTLTSYQVGMNIFNEEELVSKSFTYVNGSSEMDNIPAWGIDTTQEGGYPHCTFVSSAGPTQILPPNSKWRLGTFICIMEQEITQLPNISFDTTSYKGCIITGEKFENSTHLFEFNTEEPMAENRSSSLNMKNTEKYELVATPITTEGFQAAVQGNLNWENSNSNLFKLVVAPDYLSAVIEPLGGIGTGTVDVWGDADLGPNVLEIHHTINVTIEPGQANAIAVAMNKIA